MKDRTRVALAAAAAIASASTFAPQPRAATIVSTFKGGNAAWESAANWNNTPASNTFPKNAGATTYDATVSTGNAALNTAVTIQKFTLGGTGNLSGTGTLTLNETFTWSTGNLAGSNVVNANGGLAITGTTNRNMSGTLNLPSGKTGTFAGGYVNASNDSTVINNAGTFQLQGDGGFTGAGTVFVRSTFNNSGLLTKNGGTGTTEISFLLSNTGTVSATVGTLRLSGGGTQTGSFNAGAGAFLEFGSVSGSSNGANFAPGSSITGANVTFASGFAHIKGTYNVTGTSTFGAPTFFDAAVTNPGATMNVNNGTVNFADATPLNTTTLNLNGGSLLNTGPLTASTVNWSSGALSGPGTVTASVSLIISGTNGHNFGGALKNLGAGTWSGTNINMTSATLDNAGTFTVTDDSDLLYSGGTTPFLKNSGSFTKAGGTGVTLIQAFLQNAASGTITASTGTLRFILQGTNAGHIGGAGTIEFGVQAGSGTYESTPGSLIDAANVRLTESVILSARGTYAALHTTATNSAVFHPYGTQSYPVGATLDLLGAGQAYLETDAGAPAPSSHRLSIHTSGTAQLFINSTQHLAALNMDGNSKSLMGLTGLNGSTLSTHELSIANSAQLDIDENQIVVDYPQIAATPLPGIRAALLSGYNGGAWNGPGIVSTTAKFQSNRALGYGEAADALGLSGAQTATWLGNTVDATSVLVRFTLFGDATLDGSVDFNDLVKLAQNYNTGSGEKAWSQGDFTYDGVVDFNDLVKLAQNYNTAFPSSPVPGAPANFQADLAAAFAAVPEPSTVLLIACGFAPLVKRRRRAH